MIPTGTAITCWACFKSSNKDKLSKGDTGVGACYNGNSFTTGVTGQFIGYGSIVATGSASFKADTNNGYDDGF